MNRIIFYKNVRQDGGIRIGLDANGIALFEHFVEGGPDYDPALVWFLDIELEWENPPAGRLPDDYRRWFLSLAPQINVALEELAKRLEVGIDQDWLPFRHEAKTSVSMLNQQFPVTIRIKGTAQNRIRNTEIAQEIRNIKNSWENELAQAESTEAASR